VSKAIIPDYQQTQTSESGKHIASTKQSKKRRRTYLEFVIQTKEKQHFLPVYNSSFGGEPAYGYRLRFRQRW